MNEVIAFEYLGKAVRGFMSEGGPVFVATDVAQLLGYSDRDQAVRDHCKRARPIADLPVETTGKIRLHGSTRVIDEGDVCRGVS
jgi:anti-repressor protein